MPLSPTDVLFPTLDPENPPPIADLDRASGVMRVFRSYASWRDILESDHSKLGRDDLYALEALTHEATHLLQLCITGFGYDLSFKLFASNMKAIQDHAELDDIYLDRASYSKPIVDALSTLSEEGDRGLTASSIIESAAFLAQKATHYPGLDERAYGKALEEAPDIEYHLAYDIATEFLEDALDLFPLVANVSLNTSKPAVVFIPLLQEYAVRASRLDREVNYAIGQEFLAMHYPELLLASPRDQISTGKKHPILERIVSTLGDLVDSGELSMPTIFGLGRPYNSAIAELIAGPILFPPTPETKRIAPMWVPASWQTEVASARPLLAPVLVRLYAATSQLLQQDVPDLEPSPSILSSAKMG